MGAACCVASRDRTIINGTRNEIVQRNVRYSPSWSFRWDNRGRVAGEDTAVNWSSVGISRLDNIDNKSISTVEAIYASEDGSPLNSSQTLTWQKSPISETNTERLPLADQSTSRKSPAEVKDSVQSQAISSPSPAKLSTSMNSTPLSTSPLSSRGHFFPGSSTPSRRATRIPIDKSPNVSLSEESSFLLPGWSNESNRGSNGGSSDSWSIPAFTELVAASHRERWSSDSDPFGVQREKIARSSSRLSSSPHNDVQACGVCSKLLTERFSWEGQKILATEVAVVAVLICGHVYHAVCLENMTLEINKYEPVCPVCTLGEKKTLKKSEKALKMEINSRARNKRSRKHIVNSDQDDDSGRYEEKGIKMMVSSSSTKSSLGKPFLKRHFSFGSKGNRSLLEDHSLSNATRRKAFFWSKSTKQ